MTSNPGAESDRDNELIPFPECVNASFKVWLASQESSGKRFTEEQRHWLELIRDHVAGSLAIETDDFEYPPFVQQGGLGRFYQVFGDRTAANVLASLNEALAV